MPIKQSRTTSVFCPTTEKPFSQILNLYLDDRKKGKNHKATLYTWLYISKSDGF